MKKLQQVSSDDHQMSLVGWVSWVVRYPEGGGWDISGPMSRGVTLPCDLSHDACDVTYPRLLWIHTYL